MHSRELIHNFLNESLFNVSESVPWNPSFYGSMLPICPRQLMLAELYKDKFKREQTFQERYDQEIGKAAHKLIQHTWTINGVLWGDWKCTDFDNCGVSYTDQILSKCPRCGANLIYREKKIKDLESGFVGKCDGIVYCKELNGYLIAELKSRNTNIIKAREGQEPYPSDLYQVSAYATLISKKFWIPIVGRLVLWIGKPKYRPYQFWFYPGLGEELFKEQTRLKLDLDDKIKNNRQLEVKGRCSRIEDADGCYFAPICFSEHRDKIILERIESNDNERNKH